MKCLNRDTLEYQILKQVSGVSGFALDSCIRYYLDTQGRYPYLDEIPGVDSSKNLEDTLEVQEINGVKYLELKKIKEFTGVDTVNDAIPIINNKYKDIQVDVTEITAGIALIKIEKRPSEYGIRVENVDVDTTNVNSKSILVKSLNKLKNLYGFNFIEIDSNTLSTDEWKNKVPEANSANAFIYNGDIYINTDTINVEEAKIHELLHLFLGAMRYSNPNVYLSLIQQMENLPTIQTIKQNYPNRTHQDILEETFVTEFAKYLTNQDSIIQSLPKETINEIFYNLNRTLDTVLWGKYSVKNLDPKVVASSTLPQLAEQVESNICNTVAPVFINASALHRRVANTKQALLKQDKLKEECK